MSDRPAMSAGEPRSVLVVGSSPPVERTAATLAATLDSTALLRARTVSAAREHLASASQAASPSQHRAIHCLVCEFTPESETDAAQPTPLAELVALAADEDIDSLPPIVAITDDERADDALDHGATDVISPADSRATVAARVRNVSELRHHRDSAADSGTAGVPEFSGAQLAAALDLLPTAVFTLGPAGELEYANAAAREFFRGASDATVRNREETPLEGTVVWELLPAEIRETVVDRCAEARATGSVVQFETPLPERLPALAPSSDGPSTARRRLVVTAVPDENRLTVLAREFSDPESESDDGVERDRLALLEEAVDALEDGIAVLEDGTIRIANTTLCDLAGTGTLVGTAVDALFDDELAAAIRERADSPVSRWMDPIQGELDGGGSTRSVPVDVVVAPLSVAERTLCVVRDRRRSAAGTLSTVRRTIDSLSTAASRSAVRHAVVAGIREYTGAEFTGWYRPADDGDLLSPAAITTAESVPRIEPPAVEREDVPLQVGRDGDGRGDDTGGDSYRDTVHAALVDRAAADPFLARSGLRAERVLVVPLAERGVIVATSSDPMAFDTLETAPIETVSAAGAAALDRIAARERVRTSRYERARLESKLDAAAQLRAGERHLLDADSRTAVERRLCEIAAALAPADADELAWVGRVTAGNESISPRTWSGSAAGRDGEWLDSRTIPIGPDTAFPSGRAAARRDSVVIDDLAETAADAETHDGGENPDTTEFIRAATDRGLRSALSVPIEHDAFSYGTLTVAADRPAAFDDHSRRVYAHLAAVAGHAIGALERKRALLADRVTELELVLRESDDVLVALAHELGQPLDVQAVVPRSAGGSTVYCTLPSDEFESPPASRLDSLAELDGVGRVRSVGEGETGSVVEFTIETETIADTLAAHNGLVRTLVPVDGRTRVALDLPDPVDVRSFVEGLQRAFPSAELVSRRERERETRSPRAFDAAVRERLSERQFQTLEAAYYGGFFAWPRKSTGEEIADSLAVSQPTFSRHLRTAQRKLFELLFDEY
ncbi:bacterio-opsin activator domain-containing protein [Natrialba asiatica]|uniref:PAS/PAC sensor protein n=1 Tax=Natrialba asiatica (strain ATCC 700177 / DSM 12278 / JCM 9576 / FERM P-10747 / NBRC 102637 / 172P1) TaxID=29540 RepID=M0AT82_NATA1|nr:bacterio-opsin activator domain-containing protein [Natrialba asiatica]ELZ00579.1 PAS/PAC sensor protein [Natrialba asiatica DSM 12278]